MPHARLPRRHLPLMLAALGGTLLVACGRTPTTTTPSRPGLAARPARGEWPPAVLSADPEVQAAYRYAVANPTTLSFIPCYCGCGSLGHQSNKDCYIVGMPAESGVLLDTHGLGCSHCVGITLDVMEMEAAGRSLPDIRAAIDQKWRGPQPGTDTPLPTA